MTEIKQFKLSSGEEIICDIVQWPDVENDEADIIIRNVFKIIALESPMNGDKYYTFRPWMTFQDEEGMLQLLNGNHVMAECNPSERLLNYYFVAVKGESNPNDEEAKKEIQKKLDDYINNLRSMVENRVLQSGDSDTDSKIIAFPRRTLH